MCLFLSNLRSQVVWKHSWVPFDFNLTTVRMPHHHPRTLAGWLRWNESTCPGSPGAGAEGVSGCEPRSSYLTVLKYRGIKAKADVYGRPLVSEVQHMCLFLSSLWSQVVWKHSWVPCEFKLTTVRMPHHHPRTFAGWHRCGESTSPRSPGAEGVSGCELYIYIY